MFCRHKRVSVPGDRYANSMRESFHNVYILSNHKVYTLNIWQFYLSITMGKSLHWRELVTGDTEDVFTTWWKSVSIYILKKFKTWKKALLGSMLKKDKVTYQVTHLDLSVSSRWRGKKKFPVRLCHHKTAPCGLSC